MHSEATGRGWLARRSDASIEITYSVPGAPDTLGLTPDGSQLWVSGDDSGVMTVIDKATGQTVGSTNLGGNGANSGDASVPTVSCSPPRRRRPAEEAGLSRCDAGTLSPGRP